ncbi:MAG: hydrogen peroxide-inducible genes activator [Pseudomonadales bacterium]
MAYPPKLKQLKYLCALAETLHFGKAADICHVSQSTLSAGIQELEELLAVALVERTNKKVLLTRLGKEVVARSVPILANINDLVSLCESAGEALSGKIYLGIIPTIAPFILPALVAQLEQQYPRCQLIVREDLSGHLIKSLQAGELDLLLLALPYPAAEVETLHLFDDEFLLAITNTHPLANNTTVSVDVLNDLDLLLLEEGHCLRQHALEACQLKDQYTDNSYQAASLNTIVQLVANDIGVTLLPRMALRTPLEANIITRSFTEPNISRSIGLMWRKQSSRRAEFKLLASIIKLYQNP